MVVLTNLEINVLAIVPNTTSKGPITLIVPEHDCWPIGAPEVGVWLPSAVMSDSEFICDTFLDTGHFVCRTLDGESMRSAVLAHLVSRQENRGFPVGGF
jgi:hypothetical protein